MCGIAGIVEKKKDVSLSELKKMTQALEKRGPDAEGFYTSQQIGLGHRRLSILDINGGNQPLYNENKTIVLVFNGEIYNFKELRERLIAGGHQFSSSTDSEVILHAYEEYGFDSLLEKIEGMFAFALYDENIKTLWIARDRFGEKPLYYYENENTFYFGSELKCLLPVLDKKEISTEGLNYFFALSYIPAPYSIYKNVYKLKPGTYLRINKDSSTEVEYYDLLSLIEQNKKLISFDSAKKEVEISLRESVNQRMVSDVPIGSFLSGGIDSAIVSTLMSELSEKVIQTFTLGFHEDEYDESKKAKLLAEKIGSDHSCKTLGPQDALKSLKELILYFDEPFGDSSALPSYFVAKQAKEKVAVVLTGDGADEIFGGYEKYLAAHYIERYNRLPKSVKKLLSKIIMHTPLLPFTNAFLRKAKKVLDNASLSSFDLHYNLMCMGYTENERKNLLLTPFFKDIKPEIEKIYNTFTKGDALEKGFYTDLKIVLEGDMLTKVDRMCMINSLEARTPFLDSKIVEKAFMMPSSFKIRGNNKKYILKKAFSNLLPNRTIRAKKSGFGVPVDYWFKEPLKAELLAYMDPTFIQEQAIFNYQIINQLANDHIEGKANHKNELWCFFVFQQWYKEIFAGSSLQKEVHITDEKAME